MKSINLEKSIEKNKLVFCEDLFDKVSSLLGKLFIVSCLLFYSIINFIGLYGSNNLLFAFSVLFLGLIFTSAILYSFKNNKNLKIIKIKSKHNNIHDVKNYIKRKNWKILMENKNYIKVNVHDKFSGFHWGRNMYIIFSKSNVLINSSTVDSFGHIISFNWFGNRKVEDEFIKEFQLNEK